MSQASQLSMDQPWKPFSEPVRTTLVRTVSIAILGGAGLSWGFGSLRYWPAATLALLWVSVGGHIIEVLFLNYIRPRLPSHRVVHAASRIIWWLAGGLVLGLGAKWTAATAGLPTARWPAWWVAGPAFVGVELVAHLVMVVRRVPNFYSGRA